MTKSNPKTKSGESLPILVYSPESNLSNPIRMLRSMFLDLAQGRELAWRLAVRDIMAMYRQAYLGILWAFIIPLANTIIWIFLSSSGVVSVSDTELPYAVYVFTGTMLWAIFIESLNAPLQQVSNARSMLSKLNFPRESLIMSGIYQNMFNAAIKIVLLLIVLIYMGISPGWNLIWFPLGVLSLILVGTTIGLFITPIGVLYTDIGRALPLLTQFLMYITPVVFPMPSTGIAKTLFEVNPASSLILTTRDWLTGQEPEFLITFIIVNIASFFVLLMVWIIYRLAMPILIERMGS